MAGSSMEVGVWVGIGSVSGRECGLNNRAATMENRETSHSISLIKNNRSAHDGFFTLQILEQLVLGEFICDSSGYVGRSSDRVDGASAWVLVNISSSILIDLFKGVVNLTNCIIIARSCGSNSSKFADFECVCFTSRKSRGYRSFKSNRLVRELGEVNCYWGCIPIVVYSSNNVTFGEDWAVDRFIRRVRDLRW